MKKQDLLTQLIPFGDIGEEPVKITEQGDKFTVKMIRDGKPMKLSVDGVSGKIQCTWGSFPARGFASFSALLASEIFANLKRWGDAQALLLRELDAPDKLLPFQGTTHDKKQLSSVDEIDSLLGGVARSEDFTEILLIDGPAGIGKTSLIEQLALKRASAYKTAARPLILHVKSRGRVLSNLQDLMAFSLQTIRSQITYDQIPVLAKHGLVVIAIDGFDELADPNGYEMAWAQLSDLIAFIRGKGTLILAGRDTFINRSRLLEDVEVLREGKDSVIGLTLGPPLPDQAKAWLAKQPKHPWTQENFEIPSIAVLLERGSFALRPVFLRILAKHIKPKELEGKHERYLTPLLVNEMIRREAGLFGKPINAVLNESQREGFLNSFLCETARQMADSQVEALDASEVAWISEAALEEGLPSEVVALIRNRAGVVAFFVNDERNGYKTFLHSYLMNYFLALVVVDAIGRGDIPKFVRRNLLGSEFLSVFCDVVAEAAVADKAKFDRFFEKAAASSLSYTSVDRGLRNLGALALAALSAVIPGEELILREFSIDDGVIRGICPDCVLENFEISQLDIRGADLSSVTWTGGAISGVIADSAIRVSPSFPLPTKISLADDTEIIGAEAVSSWLASRGRDAEYVDQTGLATLRSKPLYLLLMRAARLRQYWLRAEADDFQASKILNDRDWPELAKILVERDLLREEIRQASGRSSKFFHIKHRESILSESVEIEALAGLFEDIRKS